MTMTYSDLLADIKTALEGTFPGVDWSVGMDTPNVPGSYVWIAPALGPGLDTEWLTDVRACDITVAGDQNDYAGAESLAFAVDRHVLGQGGSRTVANNHVINVSRTGGAPYAIEHDDSERTVFVCGYLHEVYSGVV